MADKVTNTVSILATTDESLKALAENTFLRFQGSVIDFAISELVKAIHAGAHSTLVKPGKEQFVKDLDCEAGK
jgi:hypothetical protein